MFLGNILLLSVVKAILSHTFSFNFNCTLDENLIKFYNYMFFIAMQEKPLFCVLVLRSSMNTLLEHTFKVYS